MQEPSSNRAAQPTLLRRLLTRENLIAMAVCLILIALVIATADNAPQWIYQGF
ncbi:MAG: hypothetical protein M1434_00620 [Chloroflexi bacterium]|nr:hypothetical protein [Chloroflexota bacterium]MCL5273236.1 hypothetical protein [Chloroflexota bacterium]